MRETFQQSSCEIVKHPLFFLFLFDSTFDMPLLAGRVSLCNIQLARVVHRAIAVLGSEQRASEQQLSTKSRAVLMNRDLSSVESSQPGEMSVDVRKMISGGTYYMFW